MKTTLVTRIVLLSLFIVGLAASLGCGSNRGGVEIWLEGVSMGTMSMDGKPISGLPSQKTNLLLKVGARKIYVSSEGNKTVMRLLPSEAKIIIGPEGMSLEGVQPDQVEIKWETPETKK
ncbi:MAG: hypothetical protein FJZ83_05630 [Chloroflexi bacterium]|nr:hypothetical protein [Chloroflexota bacterium]MBM3183499.1 hypothetical protein [Chloroflexota bacterium]MBM4454760.1 hypothetical protein [Chloroflexota bacterium]